MGLGVTALCCVVLVSVVFFAMPALVRTAAVDGQDGHKLRGVYLARVVQVKPGRWCGSQCGLGAGHSHEDSQREQGGFASPTRFESKGLPSPFRPLGDSRPTTTCTLYMGESCLQLCPSRTSPFPYYGFSWQLNNFRTPRAREPMTGIWKGLVPGPHMRKIRSASSSLISRVFLRHAARAQTNGRSVPSDNLFPARRLGNERLLKRLRGRGAPPVLCAPRAGGTRVSGRHS